ncbi:MAG: hypothetical protein KAI64_00505, partial [Thermoplasmata archaeon]|nr:hypothetical protein [Thermoplasmata archaeon]
GLNTTNLTFLTNYLHAAFVQNNAGDSQALGVALDPISDPWSATPISIGSSSPDEIDPADVSTNVTFTYNTAGTNASLRSQHDADSRLLFFGFIFFDQESYTGVADATRANVLQSLIDNWLMPTPNASPAPSNITNVAPSPDYQNITLNWSASADDGGGEDDVEKYNIHWSLHYGGPFYYLDSIPATGAPTYSWVHLNSGDFYPNTIFYKISAEDRWTKTLSSEVAVKFYKPYVAGPNLASIPMPPADTSVASVLQQLSFDKVWAFNASDVIDPWKSYIDAKPAKGDLTDIDSTMGFWVNSLSAVSYFMVDLVPSCTNVNLVTGWNLVSYPAFTERTVANALTAITYE